MSEATAPQQFDLAPASEGALLATAAPEDGRFRIGLAAAVLAHGLVFGGLIVAPPAAQPQRLGDARGTDNAISVDFVSEAELKGNATVADQAAGQPAPPPPPPPAQAAPRPPERTELPQPPQPPAPAPAPPPPEPAPQPAEVAPPPPPPAPALKLLSAPDASLDAIAKPNDAKTPAVQPSEAVEPSPQPAPKTPEVKPPDVKPPENKPLKPPPPKPQAAAAPKPPAAAPQKPPAKPAETRTANLDLSAPPLQFNAPAGGGGAGIERPPGTTKSGANDAFARGVIRALQITMPQLVSTVGRVTVRIALDRNGNLVGTTVLRVSNVPGLDQSVVFATRQASFPIPPSNANDADLVFFVTYIYR